MSESDAATARQPLTLIVGSQVNEFASELDLAASLLDRMTSDERGKLRYLLSFAGNTGAREKVTKKGDAPLIVRETLSPMGGI